MQPPLREPLMTNGRLSPIWAKWFISIYQGSINFNLTFGQASSNIEYAPIAMTPQINEVGQFIDSNSCYDYSNVEQFMDANQSFDTQVYGYMDAFDGL